MAFILIFVLSGCKPSVPSYVLSPDEMEDLLYDYHLADAMAHEATGEYASNLVAYRTAVLKKYNVTQEKFDTSMVYYMRHTDRLLSIYEHIADRMQRQAVTLGTSSGELARLSSYSATGDTANIWTAEKSIVLIPNRPYNVYSYSLPVDTSFHKGDSFILNMKSDFIFQDGVRDGIAVLAVVYANDSVVSRMTHISFSTNVTIRIDNPDTLAIKELKGYFLLNNGNQSNSSSTTLRVMCLSNIHLLRCHPTKTAPEMMKETEAPQIKDALKTDSPVSHPADDQRPQLSNGRAPQVTKEMKEVKLKQTSDEPKKPSSN